MTVQTRPVTIDLPDPIYRQLQQTAIKTKRRLEDVLLQTISGNLPPGTEDAPADMQAELQALQWADDKTLWAAARSRVSPEQQARQEHLLAQNQRGVLTSEERLELERLGDAIDRLTLKKAYAYALLRWRGFPLPSLEAMERQL
jgi:hypothetical protein